MGNLLQGVVLMDSLELNELVLNGENSYMEFKSAEISSNDLASEIVAFANFEGGTILVGVEDNGEITGIKMANAEEYFMNICRNNVIPNLIPKYEEVSTDKGVVAVLSIPKGLSKPYSTNNRYYIRVGTTKRIATREELMRLFQASGMVHFDISPVIGSNIKDLKLDTIRDYYMKYNSFDLDEETTESKVNILLNADILTEYEGRVLCTVGGLLIFGKNIEKYLPQAGITFAHFNGKELTAELIDKKNIVDTLPEQVEKILQVFEINILKPSTIVGAKREERELYPRVALREALVNAVAHRNYQITGSKVRIFMFDDRIEFRSPGRLPNTVTIEKMKVGVSYARNPFIVKYLENLRYIDQLGRGIPMILREMKTAGSKEPDLRLEGEEFVLVLYAGY
jgi:ATP-dependent DNA helicase RecG